MPSTCRLPVTLDEQYERPLIEEAAKILHTSLSGFTAMAAVEKAQQVIASRTVFNRWQEINPAPVEHP